MLEEGTPTPIPPRLSATSTQLSQWMVVHSTTVVPCTSDNKTTTGVTDVVVAAYQHHDAMVAASLISPRFN